LPATTPLAAYRERLRAGEIEPDPGQALAVEKLNLLHRRLGGYRPSERRAAGWLARLGLGVGAAPETPPPLGLYLYGGVGRGKSMLMDLFFAAAPLAAKRRVHFHAFMLEVHARIHEWRQQGRASRTRIGADPIPPIAADLAAGAWLLCFDEFLVKDPADALILDRLFSALFENGVVVVATSNLAPVDLYRDGINRDRFLPFIGLIERRMDVLALDGAIDYRLRLLARMPVYFTPADARARAALEDAFATLTNPAPPVSETIDLGGRVLTVPRAAKGVAYFSFADLCDRPLGAADYLAIADRYHGVIVADVPRLDPEKRDQAARFTTLIDVLYERRIKLLCSAEAEPEALYPTGHGSAEFRRAVSRLHEMRGAAYLGLGG